MKLEPGARGASDTTALPLRTPVSAYVILAIIAGLQDLATRTQLHWLSKNTTGASKLRLEALESVRGRRVRAALCCRLTDTPRDIERVL